MYYYAHLAEEGAFLFLKALEIPKISPNPCRT